MYHCMEIIFLAHLMVLLGDLGQVEALSVCLEIVLISALDGCTVSPNGPRAWKSFWAHPMVLLGDVCQVEARFGPFGDGVSLGARSVNDLHQMYHGHGNHFTHIYMFHNLH
jgi:hypothetical protein